MMNEMLRPDSEARGGFQIRPTGSGSRTEIDLRELLRTVWRHRMAVMGTVISFTVLVGIVVFQLTPRYTATARVMLEPRQTQVVDVEAVLSGLSPDTELLNSELQVIQSRLLVERVVERLRLMRDPEFNGWLREENFWDRALSLDTYIPSSLWGGDVASEGSGPVDEDAEREAEVADLIRGFLDRLSAEILPRSWVIEISFESESPEKAAIIANAVANLYIVEQLETKYEAIRHATDWLGGRLSELRAEVEASDRAVEQYRQEQGLIQGADSTTLAAQQLTELNSQLILARSARLEAEARLEQVEAVMNSGRGYGAILEVSTSSLIEQLLIQQSDASRRVAELSQELGPRHPRMVNLQAELADVRATVETEVRKISQGLRSEVAVSQARERSLRESVTELEARMAFQNDSSVQLRALERDAEGSRLIYESFLDRFNEMTGQEDIQAPDARVISPAEIPDYQSFPKRKLVIAAGFLASILLGFVVVLAIEHLDAGFRSLEQIESLAGVTALGLVPRLDPKKYGDSTPEMVVVEKPISAFSESIRNLHVGLALSDVDRPPRTLLVTSALPEEGKTSIALSLLRTGVAAGKKSVILDCDLRRPRVHEALGMPVSPGLVELLANEATLEEVAKIDEATGAHVITAGERAPNSTDLLASHQMKKLLSELAETYDMVVLDSPPVFAVSDARILAPLSDKTVFVTRWETTRRDVALHALKQIRESGGSLAGVVLSMVNIQKNAEYGYADSGQYHDKYSKYYSD